ncbi:putative alpha/beta hydrolase [Stagonosporopsis vannaccii]|nr:putative alpha/beta hydrolase [Stagonosporopsis vannaccii]
MASDAGVLWVSSKIVSPSNLSTAQFDDWYENEHALEVLVLPGIPSAIRYTALSPSHPSPHLITYEFPSLSYTADPSFQAVANTPPPPSLVDRIYAHASFDIRFYSELPTPAPPHPSPSDPNANLALASIALHPVEGREAAFLAWFAKELTEGLSSVAGFVRLRRFELVNSVLRESNVVSVPSRPKYLVLAKFERAAAAEESVRGEVEAWLAKAGLARADVGWFGVKKAWKEGEVGKLGEAP